MQLARPAIAVDPRRFGRGPLRDIQPVTFPASSINADLKLFAATFAAGFLFVSVLIG
jgi:hypothetical protein